MDLTTAMGINRPSLYAAFGNKEALFRQALDEPTARAVVEQLLRGVVELLTDPHHPRGCLMVQGALSCGKAADVIRQELVSRRAAGEWALRQRFERAIAEGDLPALTNAADLARYVATIMHGLAVQATGGASGEELRRVGEMVLRAWPG